MCLMFFFSLSLSLFFLFSHHLPCSLFCGFCSSSFIRFLFWSGSFLSSAEEKYFAYEIASLWFSLSTDCFGIQKKQILRIYCFLQSVLSSKLYGIQTFESFLAAFQKKILYPLQLKNSKPRNINCFSENCEKSISTRGRWESEIVLVNAANGAGGE